MSEPEIVQMLNAFHQLFEVVTRNRLLKSPGLGKHHKEVSLVGREHEIGIRLVSECNDVQVQTLDHVGMFNVVVDLALILRLVNFGLLNSFVQLHKYTLAVLRALHIGLVLALRRAH